MPTPSRLEPKKEKGDGFRVLVDRLWPRGISKEEAALDLWLKEVAPSDALRKWYGHDPKKWSAFRKRYEAEIAASPDAFGRMKEIAKEKKIVTLLYAARDGVHNQAAVLKSLLLSDRR